MIKKNNIKRLNKYDIFIRKKVIGNNIIIEKYDLNLDEWIKNYYNEISMYYIIYYIIDGLLKISKDVKAQYSNLKSIKLFREDKRAAIHDDNIKSPFINSKKILRMFINDLAKVTYRYNDHFLANVLWTKGDKIRKFEDILDMLSLHIKYKHNVKTLFNKLI